MHRNVTRILWAAAGILLILAGTACLLSPGAALSSLSLLVGIPMLISGIADILIFAVGHSFMTGSGGRLVDGILAVVLSLFLLCDQWFTALTVPFIFGMWLLFSGVNAFVNSFELKLLGVRGWGWFTALGLLLAGVGFFSFLDPLASFVAITVLVGVFLILQGIASLLRGCFSSRFWP